MNITDDKEIINVLSVKHRLNPEVIQNILNHSMKCIKECMSMEEMPNILLHNLGRFKTDKRKLDRIFGNILRHIEKNPENIKKIDLSKIRRYFIAYERLIKEENKTMGKYAAQMKTFLNKIDSEQETN